ncbi:MAG: family peptidase, partial [Chitinophagaceae bacterium]|nr:family peptidase [Chitinophagaceae bacterium]
MKRIILAFAAIASLSVAMGQQKQLTTSQMLSGSSRRGGGSADTKTIIKDIPRVTGWADDTHYMLSRSKEGGGFETVAVDVKTGAEQPYIPPVERKASVSIKSSDVFYKSEDGKEKQLTNNKDEEKNPTLSPDGQKVAFTRNNDLYTLDVTSGKETRLTSDGTDLIYNGWSSWVYFEEILGRATRYRAFWWSPDSRHLAYMHFNDTRVPLFPIYGSDGQHGYLENTRYPLVGDQNPEVKIGIADIETTKTTWADFNEKDDQYFGTPFWSPDGKSLWQQWMDRPQHHLIVYAIDPATGSKRPVYDEQQKTWVDWLDNIHFLENNKGYIVQSDKSGWMHIYQYDMNGNPVNQVTNGNWTVKDILKIDEKKGMSWFTARKENTARF